MSLDSGRRIVKARRTHISLKEIEQKHQQGEVNEKSLENPMFDIKNLKRPFHMLDTLTKK